MDVNFFTWNVEQNLKPKFYADLNAQLLKTKIDVLVLQECYRDHPIPELKDYIEIKEFLSHGGRRFVRLFIKKKSTLQTANATSYLYNKIRCVKIKTEDDYVFNLVGVHLYSKTGRKELDQYEENLKTGDFIREFEELSKTRHTLVIGDLNHHPFDIALQSKNIFTALNDKNLIRSLKTRQFHERAYPYFYNPMWNLLGDHQFVGEELKVPGSYYWLGKQISDYHWNLFDGTLVSSEMMDQLDITSLKIVTEVNLQALVDYANVASDKTILTVGFSDHLPLQFTVKTTLK